MKIRLFISSGLSELQDLLDCNVYAVTVIDCPIKIIQIQSTQFIHLIFEGSYSASLMSYLKANEGQKAIVLIKPTEIKQSLPALIKKYHIQYIELQSLQEFPGFLASLSQILDEAAEDTEEMLMLQKREENFKPNQLWIKFLSCIPGISYTKADAISKVYPNFQSLLVAYSKSTEENRPIMLKDITTGSINVGKVASQRVYRYINAEDPEAYL